MIQDKCQAISNGILRLTKDIRLIKSELDALNKAKHEILLQQKESDDRNVLFFYSLKICNVKLNRWCWQMKNTDRS